MQQQMPTQDNLLKVLQKIYEKPVLYQRSANRVTKSIQKRRQMEWERIYVWAQQKSVIDLPGWPNLRQLWLDVSATTIRKLGIANRTKTLCKLSKEDLLITKILSDHPVIKTFMPSYRLAHLNAVVRANRGRFISLDTNILNTDFGLGFSNCNEARTSSISVNEGRLKLVADNGTEQVEGGFSRNNPFHTEQILCRKRKLNEQESRESKVPKISCTDSSDGNDVARQMPSCQNKISNNAESFHVAKTIPVEEDSARFNNNPFYDGKRSNSDGIASAQDAQENNLNENADTNNSEAIVEELSNENSSVFDHLRQEDILLNASPNWNIQDGEMLEICQLHKQKLHLEIELLQTNLTKSKIELQTLMNRSCVNDYIKLESE